ncbi:MAG TPA: hypothetical protein VLV83_26785 [Acidobacteriota bacterium]|nr:hypothetical protein [Acidobacteriota bacterium]
MDFPSALSEPRRYWPLLLLGLMAAGLFADALLPSRTLIPTGFLYQRQPWSNEVPQLAGDPAQQYDLLHQFYPWARFYRESLLNGQLPLWDPHSYLGTPFWANPQAAVLFPGTWLHLLMPPQHSFTLLFMLKAALGLIGMFVWLRRTGLPVPAAFLGASVFGLSTHTLVSLAFPYSNVTVLFPWALLALDRLLESGLAAPGRGRTGSWTAAALGVGLLVAAGQPQSALLALAALALYGLIRLLRPCPRWAWPAWQGPPGTPSLLRRRLLTVLLAGSAVLSGGMLCALQWMPALDYVAESMVGHGPRILSSGLPYLPGNLLNFLVPDLFGSPLEGDFWGFPGYHDAAFYSSLTALLLVPLAFLPRSLRPWSPKEVPTTDSPAQEGTSSGPRHSDSLRPRQRPPDADVLARPDGPLFPAVLGLLSLGLMFGLPLLEMLLDFPGFDLIRRNKAAFLAVFALAVLAAQGCGRLIAFLRRPCAENRGGKVRKKPLPLRGALTLWAVFLASACLAALHYYRAERVHFSGGSFSQPGPWIALSVLTAALAVVWLAPASWRGLLLAALVAGELLAGGYGLNPRGSSQALFPPLPVLQDHLTGTLPRIYSTRHTLLAPNSAMVYGLQDVRGYDVVTPRRLFRYMQAIDPALGDEWTALQALPRSRLHPQSRLRQAFDMALESDWGPELQAYLKSESYWSVTASRITRPDLFRRLNIEWLWTPPGKAPSDYDPVEDFGPVTLHQNAQAAAAGIFFNWVEAGNASEALRRVQRLDRPTTVVVEAHLPQVGQPPAEAELAEGPGGGPSSSPSWELLESTPTRRSFRVRAPAPAVFVDFGRYSPGWMVRTGEEETPALAVDSLFRGVFLLPGQHRVEFFYRPGSLGLGALLSGLALIVCLTTLALGWRAVR